MALLERLRFFCLAAAVGCPALLYSFAGEAWREYQSHYWPKTEGTVVQTYVMPNSDEKGRRFYVGRVAYTYRVDNQDYRSERINFGNEEKFQFDQHAAQSVSKKFVIGQRVEVYFNPAVPSQSVLNPGIPDYRAATLAGVTLFGVLSWCVLIHWLREWLRLRAEEAAPKPFMSDDSVQFREEDTNPWPNDIEIPEFILSIGSFPNALKTLGWSIAIALPCLALLYYSTTFEEVNFVKTLLMFFSLAGCVAAGLGALFFGIETFTCFSQGERLTFNRKTVRVDYPLGRKLEFAWRDRVHVELVDREVQYEERTSWVPIPLVGTISTYETKTYTEKRILIRDHEGKRLYQVDASAERGRDAIYWLFSRQLAAEITSLGGRVRWGHESLIAIDFSGVALGDNLFFENIQQWGYLPELIELKLDRAGLTDAVVPVLTQLATTKPRLTISAQGTSFVQPADDQKQVFIRV